MSGAPLPYQTIWGTDVPDTNYSGFGFMAYRLTFFPTVAGRICGFKFWRQAGEVGNHLAVLVARAAAGHRQGVKSAMFDYKDSGPTAAQWETQYFRPWFRVTVNQWYDLSIWTTFGVYSALAGGLVGTNRVRSGLTAPFDGQTDPYAITLINSAIQSPVANFNPNSRANSDLVAADVLFLPG